MSSSGAFDRAAHRRTDLDFLDSALRDPATLLLPVWRDQLFVRGSALALVGLRDGGTLLDAGGELAWLGTLEGRACFAVDVTALAEPLAHAAFASDEARCELVDLRTALARLDSAHTELAFYARALLVWHSRAQYCGSCGHATKPRDGGHMRLCSRGGCDTQHFPRTDPCVLVMVTDEDKVLLGRQKTFPRGMYSTLAGFVEAGETLEQAVAREVLEETGVVIEPASLRYAGSQPWPFPASLMIGFRARAARTEIVRGEELEEARWVSRGELEEQHEGFWIPPPLTLSGQLLAEFLAEKPAKLRD